MEEEFAGYVSSLNELSTGKLVIGGTYLFSAFVFPEILKRFQDLYPNVKLSLVEGHTSQLEEKLFSGEIDLLMDNYPLDDELYEKRYVKKEHLLLAVPAGFKSNGAAKPWSLSAGDIRKNVHMRPETEGVPLRLFEEEPFVLLRSHNDTRERAERIPVLPQKQIFYQIHGGIHEACRRGAGARLVLEEMKKWEKVQQLRRNTPGASMSAT